MVRECREKPCQNGGYCSSEMFYEFGKGEFCKSICKCKHGFGGLRCEIGTYNIDTQYYSVRLITIAYVIE